MSDGSSSPGPLHLFEEMLRSHLRDKNGRELSLRELLYRASELSAEEGAGDTMFSLLTLRNSLVHKGTRPRIGELEVALGALSGLHMDLAERLGVPLEHESSSEQSASTAAKFELFRDSQGAYRWKLITGGGLVIANSEAYSSLATAAKGIDNIKRLVLDAEVHESID